ncbi:unnamed protein product [Orchesella dallaii]|uniref:Uncharacterized protein n=1 Tax=Orchesella dallaii TaxID=48710 RepID=A0ABP1S754_9HEXA
MLELLATSILVVLVTALVYKIYYISRISKMFFKSNRIKEIDTSIAVSKLDILLGRKGTTEGDNYAYKIISSELAYCGISQMGNPIILLKDLNLVKKVLVKDFEYFVDRPDLFSGAPFAIKKMMPWLKVEEWKRVRTAVSPTFTTSKIKGMMKHLNSVGNEWVASFKENATTSSSSSVIFDALHAVNQYTVDVIAASVFGIRSETIKNPNSPFAKTVAKISHLSKWQLVKYFISVYIPALARIFNVQYLDPKVLEFFEKILEQKLKARMASGDAGGATKPQANDFLQLLTEARNEDGERLSQQTMNSQSLVFFFSGYRTTGSAIVFAMHALAVHQDVQNRLRNELQNIGKDLDWDYDDLTQLIYMDMVVCEVLRTYPVAARLECKCVKDYEDRDTGLFVPKGAIVAIPINAIHHDLAYYENPDTFDPNHFSPENKFERNPFAFMPFGMGPRHCIGMRFALIEIKAAIAYVVSNFRIEPATSPPSELKWNYTGSGMLPPKGLELKLTLLDK